MKKLYLSFLIVIGLINNVQAQTEVAVAPGTGTLETAIQAAVDDGSANTTTFVLSRDGEYKINETISNKMLATGGATDVYFDLTIKAADGDGARPIIKIVAKDKIFEVYDDFTLDGIFVTGADDNGEFKSQLIRSKTDAAVPTYTITFNDSHFDTHTTGIRIDGAITINVTNSIFSNFFDPDPLSPRSGKIFQDRNGAGLVALNVSNTTFYNIGGQVFLDGATDVIKETINFNNCSFVNVGQTALQLNQTKNATVTNCQFYNVGILGSEDDTGLTEVYGIQLEPVTEQAVTMSNNNFYINPDYVAGLPAGSNPVTPLNAHANTEAPNTFSLNENVAFNTFPTGFDGTAWVYALDGDFGYNQAFDSYKGGTNGSIVGDTNYEFGEIEYEDVNVSEGEGTLETAIADAVADGSVNTKRFVLARGGEYILIATIENDGYPLTIVAEEGTGARPKLQNKEKNRPFRIKGDLTLKGLFISGEAVSGDVDNHMLRVSAAVNIIIDDCHLDKNYATAMRVDESASITISNSIISNIIGDDGGTVGTGEDRTGAAIQDKGGSINSLIVTNTSFYNIGGQVFKNPGADVKNTVSFDHCTFANIGETGLELDMTKSATVTNCQFFNVGLLGSSDSSDETTDIFGIRLMDTPDQTATISNNNFYLRNYYIENLPDTSKLVTNVNPHAEGLALTETFLNDSIEFNSLPAGYDYTTGWNRSSLDGDFGYSQGLDSYTGGTDGSIVGDTNWEFAEVEDPVLAIELELLNSSNAYPNPSAGRVTFTMKDNTPFERVEVYNSLGLKVKTIENSNGAAEVRWTYDGTHTGIYFYRVMEGANTLGSGRLILDNQ